MDGVTTGNNSNDNSNASSPIVGPSKGFGGDDDRNITRGGAGEEKKGQTGSLVSYPTPPSSLTQSESKFGGGSNFNGTSSMKFKQTSSFLSGRTFDPDGYPRKGYNVVRARGLAELVGMEDFFLELHRRFVVLLAQLG